VTQQCVANERFGCDPAFVAEHHFRECINDARLGSVS